MPAEQHRQAIRDLSRAAVVVPAIEDGHAGLCRKAAPEEIEIATVYESAPARFVSRAGKSRPRA